ncbi:MAG TPA: PAS domain-containing protein [Longimicrobium sp.]|jgi:PAS domain S-box-containing protein
MNIEDALEHVSDGVVGLDAEFRVVYANGRAELLLGKRRPDLVGHGWWELFPYLAGSPAERELLGVAAARMARVFKVFHPPRYSWHEVRALPSGDGMLMVMRDITDVTRSRQQENVREVIDLAPVAISVMRGPDHRVEIMNQLSRQMLGGRDLEGETARSALPELQGQGFFEILDSVYTTGEPFQGSEVPVSYDRVGDGVMHHGFFDFTYQPIFDVGGKVNGVLSVSVEVTSLVHERARLEQRAAEQEAVLAQLAEGVIVTDREGRITFVNQTAEELHGVGRLDVPPSQYAAAYHLFTDEGEPYPSSELPLARAVVHGETVAGARWRIRRPDGTEVLVVGNARPVLDAEGERVAAVLTLRRAAAEAPPA